jgi:hypothetical protein
MQYVSGDKIFESGNEVVWRGGGGSYLFHASNFTDAWQQRIPDIQKMGLNTIRLAFAFPDSTPNSTTGKISADILDFAKMDWVLGFLAEHGVKSILDCHNYDDMSGDFGSQRLIQDWQSVAMHYKNDPRVVAYELFNEPFNVTWSASVQTKLDVVKTYVDLTNTVRQIDPQRIVIWESQPYTPPPDDIKSYLVPNLVFTFHRWWTNRQWEFQMLTVEKISYMSLVYAVEYREKLGVPFWFGEFGAHYPFNSSNPEWTLTEQHLEKCEEQVVGWNLWMGVSGSLKGYLPFFPLKVFNVDLVRSSWDPLGTRFVGYIAGSKDADVLGPYEIELWHNNDYVTINPRITIRVIRIALVNSTSETVSDEQINVTTQLMVKNDEGTVTHPGDWDTFIYPIQ